MIWHTSVPSSGAAVFAGATHILVGPWIRDGRDAIAIRSHLDGDVFMMMPLEMLWSQGSEVGSAC